MPRRLESRLGTGNATKAAANARSDAVPGPRVAIGMRLRALAAKVFSIRQPRSEGFIALALNS